MRLEYFNKKIGYTLQNKSRAGITKSPATLSNKMSKAKNELN